jgi:hypothetical protein
VGAHPYRSVASVGRQAAARGRRRWLPLVLVTGLAAAPALFCFVMNRLTDSLRVPLELVYPAVGYVAVVFGVCFTDWMRGR